MPEPLKRRGRFSKEAISRDPEAYRFSRKLASIRKRCNDQSDTSYKYYGEKGIGLCKEWTQDTENFIRWVHSLINIHPFYPVFFTVFGVCFFRPSKKLS